MFVYIWEILGGTDCSLLGMGYHKINIKIKFLFDLNFL